MFEFHAYDRRAQSEPPLSPRPDDGSPAPVDIAAMSFLFWSEHCVECAAPACYTTCALYSPRDDGRCRRFAYGLARNTRFSGPRGYGAEVAFRRWGKLKANGNAWMEPFDTIIRREAWLGRTVPLRQVLGRLARTFGRTTVWADPSPDFDRRARRLHRRLARQSDISGASGNGTAVRADAFLIEVCNPDDATVSLELEMRVAEDLIDADVARDAPPPFREVVRLEPGHNRHIVPHAAFAAITDCGLPFKLALTPIGEATPRLVILALDFVTWRTSPAVPVPFDPRRPPAIECPAIKCIVFDLDDTLWRGTLVEGGALDLVPEARRVLGELDRRGILLAVASKNDAGPARARLRHFGLAGSFVATRIDWRAKSATIAEIAAELNFGLDSFAFVDDSAFERAEVAAALPQVACFDAAALSALVDHPRLSGGTSPVARARRRLYRDAAEREALRTGFAGDEEAFLRSCGLRLEISRYRPEDFARVVELAQRTNQLNASGNRYTANACAGLVGDAGLETFLLRCVDVYGDYGIVGLAPVRFPRRDEALAQIRVEEFMLSCRVQGRRLERVFFHHLATSRRAASAESLWINFRESGRNGPAARILDDLGFRPCSDGGRVLGLPAPHLACDLVEAIGTADPPAGPAARRAVA